MSDDLVYDVGAHSGEDTDFYLGKGFRVVAIEANPGLVHHLETRFRAEIDQGRLTVVGRAIGASDMPDTISFYVNDIKDDWSAVDETTASKGSMEVRKVEVRTVRLLDLFAAHGVPYYMKVDIELSDIDVAKSLIGLPMLPSYVSFEIHDAQESWPSSRPWDIAITRSSTSISTDFDRRFRRRGKGRPTGRDL